MSIDTLVNKHRPARILLVEDNQGDVALTRMAFKNSKISNELYVAMSGEEALGMLKKDEGFTPIEKPDLILLDLNLPEMSGQEVLDTVKNDDTLKSIPVIILSSSRAEQDVVRSYNLHANGYIVKPVTLDRFGEIVDKLEEFWFTLVVMPNGEDLE